MRRSILTTFLGGLALLGLGHTTQAQSTGATFKCRAQPGEKCFVMVFFGGGNGFQTKPLELQGGETKQVPDVTPGRDHYCFAVGQPLSSRCPQMLVSNGVNE
jgi:hypothetical protein